MDIFFVGEGGGGLEKIQFDIIYSYYFAVEKIY
jgi:hypothetical protein